MRPQHCYLSGHYTKRRDVRFKSIRLIRIFYLNPIKSIWDSLKTVGCSKQVWNIGTPLDRFARSAMIRSIDKSMGIWSPGPLKNLETPMLCIKRLWVKRGASREEKWCLDLFWKMLRQFLKNLPWNWRIPGYQSSLHWHRNIWLNFSFQNRLWMHHSFSKKG